MTKDGATAARKRAAWCEHKVKVPVYLEGLRGCMQFVYLQAQERADEGSMMRAAWVGSVIQLPVEGTEPQI